MMNGNVWNVIWLLLSLGIDSFWLSASLAVWKRAESPRRDRRGWMWVMVFACAETGMLWVGSLLGKGVGMFLGRWASFAGGLMLVALAAWMVFFEDEKERMGHVEEGNGEEAEGETETPSRLLQLSRLLQQESIRQGMGWALVGSAASVSMDELMVGISAGLLDLPWLILIPCIALQALVFSSLGWTLGARLAPSLGKWSEKLAGFVLGGLGISILVDWVYNQSLA
ncbi:hypothetical protein GCM10010885_22890 [Alicyclobacillus cellulosilyticus]|uniref:Sporulation protein YtaF n=2 Tax=Alicyclobacillus cellulosilyticus TaxID=1003997 RepID=A0A917KH14_9BACL|nr:hypothetical protein GCM10010885_22890 [Alicyclobacillus cellulosilyticus]